MKFRWYNPANPLTLIPPSSIVHKELTRAVAHAKLLRRLLQLALESEQERDRQAKDNA